jgi:hypothetical protein
MLITKLFLLKIKSWAKAPVVVVDFFLRRERRSYIIINLIALGCDRSSIDFYMLKLFKEILYSIALSEKY